jgi:hypothetical protein
VVQAIDDVGNQSAFSVPRTFTLTSPSTDAPVPYLQPSSVTLSWSSLAWATSYQLQIADNKEFTVSLIDIRTVSTSYTADPPLPPGVYYWRVRPTASGITPLWNKTFKFVVKG